MKISFENVEAIDKNTVKVMQKGTDLTEVLSGWRKRLAPAPGYMLKKIIVNYFSDLSEGRQHEGLVEMCFLLQFRSI